MPECITKGEPKLEAAPPASHGMAQPKCSDYSRTDPLPLGSGRLGPGGNDCPAGKPPAEMQYSGYNTERDVRDVSENGRWKSPG